MKGDRSGEKGLSGLDSGDDFLGGIGEVVGGDDVEATGGEGGFSVGDIIAFEANDEGDGEAGFFGGGEDPVGDGIAVHDSAEDIDEDAFNAGVGEDNFEGSGDLFFGGSAADIEEICGETAGVLDDVHGGHGEAGAVDEASDIAIETDVTEIELGGGDFAWVFFGAVAEGDDFGLAVEGVVVEIEFGVEGEEIPVLGDDEGIDLDLGAIAGDEEFKESGEEFGGGVDLGAVEAEGFGEFASLEGLEAEDGVDGFAEDFFWGVFGDVFDVHAAGGAGDDDGGAGGAIDENGEVEFAGDGGGFGDEDFGDEFSFGASLVGDEGLAEHGGGEFADAIDGSGHMDTALEAAGESAFSAAARVDLGFDHELSGAEVSGDVGGFIGGMGDRAAGGGDAEFFEEFAGLVFVNVHKKVARQEWD